MTLNKSVGNMYEFVTHTWNVIKGECPHGCSYCYMKRWGKQKPLWFDEKELNTNLGTGNFIFVGSSCDMFAEAIPTKWIDTILAYCAQFNNRYLFQTKNPEHWKHFNPSYWTICTTIETNRIYPQMGKTPSPHARAEAMAKIASEKYVTIEPIMDFDLPEMVELIRICNPVQVNIGADSGHNNLPEPPLEKVKELIFELSKFTMISKKRNLERLIK